MKFFGFNLSNHLSDYWLIFYQHMYLYLLTIVSNVKLTAAEAAILVGGWDHRIQF